MSSVDQRARAIMDVEKGLINKMLTVDKNYLNTKLTDLPSDVAEMVQ